MSDQFVETQTADEPEDVVDHDTGETEEEAAGKSKKDPLPEGFLTPVGFVHLLASEPEEGGRATEVRPQQIYGYIRNNKSFAERCASQNTDGRWMLEVDEALAWWDEKEERRVEREAKKAEAADDTESEEE